MRVPISCRGWRATTSSPGEPATTRCSAVTATTSDPGRRRGPSRRRSRHRHRQLPHGRRRRRDQSGDWHWHGLRRLSSRTAGRGRRRRWWWRWRWFNRRRAAGQRPDPVRRQRRAHSVNIQGVEGSNFADQLTGDDNDNILIGAGGDDHLLGGFGSDTYLYDASDGNDRITETFSTIDINVLRFGLGLLPSDLIVTGSSATPCRRAAAVAVRPSAARPRRRSSSGAKPARS